MPPVRNLKFWGEVGREYTLKSDNHKITIETYADKDTEPQLAIRFGGRREGVDPAEGRLKLVSNGHNYTLLRTPEGENIGIFRRRGEIIVNMPSYFRDYIEGKADYYLSNEERVPETVK